MEGKGETADRRKCDCGCGRLFKPARPWQRFLNEKHRQQYHSKLRKRAFEQFTRSRPQKPPGTAIG